MPSDIESPEPANFLETSRAQAVIARLLRPSTEAEQLTPTRSQTMAELLQLRAEDQEAA